MRKVILILFTSLLSLQTSEQTAANKLTQMMDQYEYWSVGRFMIFKTPCGYQSYTDGAYSDYHKTAFESIKQWL